MRLLVVICLLGFSSSFAQVAEIEKLNFNIQSTESAPTIDGVIEDDFWSKIPFVTGFKQTTPRPGQGPTYQTEVKLTYDDEALYVAARMYDNPDSMYVFLTERDQLGNSDFFFVAFNTYRDGINGEGLGITPSGVQFDTKYSNDDESLSWDVVWETATNIDEKGWTAEFKIPWSALRFPEVEEQHWGINFGREIRRNRERSYWNFVNPTVDGFLTQTGSIKGIKNIKPPVRLFFFPYASAYVENNSTNGNSFSNSENIGMDVKYGINDAFTVDMTLIPDFGQARFDNQVLNLSQFEVQFNENRQFFTEGVELFNKAGLFYSRRIGGVPYNFGNSFGQLDTLERFRGNPNQSQLLNATKLSGRTKRGLGMGFFNAIEGNEFAEIENSETKEKRNFQTNTLTNYNVLVLDQVIRNNSFVTFTNTNVMRQGENRDANVSQVDFQLADKQNKYAVSAAGAVSNQFENGKVNTGQKGSATVEKISGNLTYSLSHEIITDRFNPNDLGFQMIFNTQETVGSVRLQNYETKKYFNFWRHNVEVTYSRIFKPDHFANFAASWETVCSTKKFNAFGLNAGAEPIETYDFFETRTFDQYYKFPRNVSFGGFISTDYSRPFAFDIRYQNRVFDEAGRYYTRLYLSPRIRPNDKLFFVFDFTWEQSENEIGYAISANRNANNDKLTMGRRGIYVHIASITSNYIFNNKMALNLNLRHYWSTATYDKLYDLEFDGSLTEILYDEGENSSNVLNENTSFNAFNIDLGFRWRFAPGSDINVVWKNVISQNGDPLERNYFNDLEQTLQSPQINNLSIKVLYFIDYLSLKKKNR
ncbi:carbohydrate binding family 9 domain-containing protein [Vicingaceae bacterium]|nr:carbohydrate binding family 9 domain-containing protein [Vicingaceae bacterium]